MPAKTLLEEALEAWEVARHGVISEVRVIPARQFDFRPKKDVRSVAELVAHVIETGSMWSNELVRKCPDFTRKTFPDFIKHYARDVGQPRAKGDWVRLLRNSQRHGARRIREVGEVQMLQLVRRFDGEHSTRLTWMHHGIAHEEYHRAQIALYARFLGLTPALTRRIEDC